MDHKEIAVALRPWIRVPDHYSVVHFAVEIGISKDLLFKMATENEELRATLDYALSVQEWKVSDGALQGTLDRTVALKLLETYSGWNNKSEINFKGSPISISGINIPTEVTDEIAERITENISALQRYGAIKATDSPTGN
jgi:hypothetical protein